LDFWREGIFLQTFSLEKRRAFPNPRNDFCNCDLS
jgi:hypothetical protein